MTPGFTCTHSRRVTDVGDLKQGVLLQIFTRPVGDRATLFFEIIQRIGCMDKQEEQQAAERALPPNEKLDMQVC
jgi:hypothetical protein